MRMHAANACMVMYTCRAAKAAATELEWVYRSQYLPQEGMFRHLPADLQLGTWLPLSKVHVISSCIGACQ